MKVYVLIECDDIDGSQVTIHGVVSDREKADLWKQSGRFRDFDEFELDVEAES